MAVVLGVSVLLQFTAAFLALRLIRLTGRRTEWVLIAAAVSLMAIGHGISFLPMVSGPITHASTHFASAPLVMAISIFMVLGIAWIAPLFVSVKRSHDVLEDSEKQFRNLVEQSPQAILVHRNHQVLFVNQAYADALGYETPEEIYRLDNVLSLIATHDRERLAELQHTRFGNGNTAVRLAYQGVRKDGSLLWLDMQARMVTWRGQPAIQSIVTDMAAQKQALESLQTADKMAATLRESEELHRVTLGSISDAVFITDDQGAFTFMSPAVEAIFGYTFEEVRAFGNIVRLLGDAPFSTDGLVSSGEMANVERMITDKYGQEHVLLVNVKRVSIQGGTVLYTCRDITERKRAEEALRESEERLAACTRGSDDGLWDWYALKDREWWSTRFFELLGYADGEIDATYEAFLEHVHPEHRDAVAKAARAHLENQQPYDMEYQLRTKDGAYRWFHSRGQATWDHEGVPIRMSGSIRDITDRRKTEEALQYERNFSSAIVDTVGVLVVVLDRGGRIVRFNRTCEHTTGYAFTEVRGKPFWELFVSPGEREATMVHFEARLRDSAPTRRQNVWLTKDGAERLIDWSDTCILDDEKNISYIISTGRDVTEQRQAEEKLRQSEERYRTMFQTTAVSLWEQDFSAVKEALDALQGQGVTDVRAYLQAHPDFVFEAARMIRVLDVNEAALSLYGAACKDELLGSVDKTFAPESFAVLREELVAIAAGDTFFESEALTQTLQGEPRHVLWQLTIPVHTDDFSRLVVNILDITDRKRAEEARDRLAMAVEQSDEMIIITDAKGIVEYTNPAFERITGYAREHTVGQYASMFRGGKHEERFYEDLWQTLKRGETWRGRLSNVRWDGTSFETRATIFPIHDATGTIINYVGVQLDVTHEMALEVQLRQAQKMEAIGTLAGGIAHDFNNILGIIIGYAELAATDVSPASPIAEHLQQVLAASFRARELIQRILLFSRSGEQERQPLHLPSLLKEVLKLLRASLPATIDIQQSISEDAGTICADLTQIHQVIMNLCANSEYAMRETGGILEVRLKATEVDQAFAVLHPPLQPGPHVHLTVRDTGHGMRPEILDRVFEPFFTTKDVGDGTGMGLAMVHGIVTNHGGAIKVQSTPDLGTVFEIYLPRVSESQESVEHDEALVSRGIGRILFVDDEPGLVRVGQAILERLGYEVVARTSSIDALEDFRSAPHRFDLVITDQTMPNMTGERLAHKLRDIRPDIPIILCTGFSHVINAEKARAIGIDAFCMKPLSERDLSVVIGDVLRKRAREGA